MKSRKESLEIQDTEEYRMHRLIKFADFITLLNATAGLTCIYFSFRLQFLFAAIALLFAVLFDYLDGKIARASKKMNDLGKNLDSLSDVISFGVAPAIFGYMIGLQQWYDLIILLFFTLCGVLRLARFNILNIKGFIGIPITTSGLLIPAIYFIFFSLSFYTPYFILIYLILGILMISSFKIPKLG